MCLHKVTDDDDRVLSEEFSKVEGSTMELKFGEDTLLESNWNPEDDNGNLLNVEPDYSLAPGQIAEYRVEVPIPNDWESGNYTVSFWAYAPTMAKGGGLSAAAEEGTNFIDFAVDPGIGANYVKRTSLDVKHELLDLTTLIVNNVPEGSNLNDAPVQTPEDAARDAGVDDGSGNNNGDGNSSNGGNNNGSNGNNNGNGNNGAARPATSSTTTTKTTTPKTGDATSAALPAALAGLGAAALAYERRRARNERQSRDGD